jgi:hydroxyacylglutathione hydrolase
MILTFCISWLLSHALLAQQDLIIISQKSGPFQVNSYLIYDPLTKEAAIIDAGSAVDSLLYKIKEEQLDLRYVFLTHSHQDHITGVNTVLKYYPKAKLCMTMQEYFDYKSYANWRNIFDSESVESWKKDSVICNLMDFNYLTVRRPDIFLPENIEFMLGKIPLKVIRTPGHTYGSITYVTYNCIFPGDLILYNSTGYLDYSLCSKDKLVSSIQKLYNLFNDEVVIYTGHGKSSTIGYEKSNNKNVSATKVIW